MPTTYLASTTAHEKKYHAKPILITISLILTSVFIAIFAVFVDRTFIRRSEPKPTLDQPKTYYAPKQYDIPSNNILRTFLITPAEKQLYKIIQTQAPENAETTDSTFEAFAEKISKLIEPGLTRSHTKTASEPSEDNTDPAAADPSITPHTQQAPMSYCDGVSHSLDLLHSFQLTTSSQVPTNPERPHQHYLNLINSLVMFIVNNTRFEITLELCFMEMSNRQLLTGQQIMENLNQILFSQYTYGKFIDIKEQFIEEVKGGLDVFLQTTLANMTDNYNLLLNVYSATDCVLVTLLDKKFSDDSLTEYKPNLEEWTTVQFSTWKESYIWKFMKVKDLILLSYVLFTDSFEGRNLGLRPLQLDRRFDYKSIETDPDYVGKLYHLLPGFNWIELFAEYRSSQNRGKYMQAVYTIFQSLASVMYPLANWIDSFGQFTQILEVTP